METFPGNARDLNDRLLSWIKSVGFWTIRAVEVFFGAIGTLIMLAVIFVVALYDFAFG